MICLGANSFLLELFSFQKDFGMQESKQEISKVVSLFKNGGIFSKQIKSPFVCSGTRAKGSRKLSLIQFFSLHLLSFTFL